MDRLEKTRFVWISYRTCIWITVSTIIFFHSSTQSPLERSLITISFWLRNVSSFCDTYIYGSCTLAVDSVFNVLLFNCLLINDILNIFTLLYLSYISWILISLARRFHNRIDFLWQALFVEKNTLRKERTTNRLWFYCRIHMAELTRNNGIFFMMTADLIRILLYYFCP